MQAGLDARGAGVLGVELVELLSELGDASLAAVLNRGLELVEGGGVVDWAVEVGDEGVAAVVEPLVGEERGGRRRRNDPAVGVISGGSTADEGSPGACGSAARRGRGRSARWQRSRTTTMIKTATSEIRARPAATVVSWDGLRILSFSECRPRQVRKKEREKTRGSWMLGQQRPS